MQQQQEARRQWKRQKGICLSHPVVRDEVGVELCILERRELKDVSQECGGSRKASHLEAADGVSQATDSFIPVLAMSDHLCNHGVITDANLRAGCGQSRRSQRRSSGTGAGSWRKADRHCEHCIIAGSFTSSPSCTPLSIRTECPKEKLPALLGVFHLASFPEAEDEQCMQQASALSECMQGILHFLCSANDADDDARSGVDMAYLEESPLPGSRHTALPRLHGPGESVVSSLRVSLVHQAAEPQHNPNPVCCSQTLASGYCKRMLQGSQDLDAEVFLLERQWFPGSHAELELHQVHTVDELSDGVFHLQAGVHLHEEELIGLGVYDELHCPSTCVTNSTGCGNRSCADLLAERFTDLRME